MILSITGHRPEKIKDIAKAAEAIKNAYETLEPEKVIQGMAAGIDILSARVAFNMGIPFVAARPWAGHLPRKADELDYLYVIQRATEVVNVSDATKFPGFWIYQKRNQWMVDNADQVFAYWDGSKGGTYNCVKYANKVGKDIYHFDPDAGYAEWIYGDETVV